MQAFNEITDTFFRIDFPAIQKTIVSYMGKMWRWIVDFTYYTYSACLAKGTGLLIVGGFVSPIMPALTMPCLGAGAGFLLSTVASEVAKKLRYPPVIWLQRQAVAVRENYPKLHLIAFIFNMFVSGISPTAAFMFGVAIGIMSGLAERNDELELQRSGDHKKLTRSTSGSNIRVTDT